MDTGEGMCCGECCELCKTDELQTGTSEANNTLYFLKNQGKKQKKSEGSLES